MNHDDRAEKPRQRTFVYHGNLPPLLALALLAPLLLLLLSVAAAALAGGAVAAFLLPLVFGRRWLSRSNVRKNEDAIELSPNDYRSVDEETRQLPRS